MSLVAINSIIVAPSSWACLRTSSTRSSPTPSRRWFSETTSIGISTTASPWARSGLIQKLTKPAMPSSPSVSVSATNVHDRGSSRSSSKRFSTASYSGRESRTAVANSQARVYIAFTSFCVASRIFISWCIILLSVSSPIRIVSTRIRQLPRWSGVAGFEIIASRRGWRPGRIGLQSGETWCRSCGA